jgi:hypothetical protein
MFEHAPDRYIGSSIPPSLKLEFARSRKVTGFFYARPGVNQISNQDGEMDA